MPKPAAQGSLGQSAALITNRTLTVAAECLKPFLLSRSLAGRLPNGEAFLNATIKAWDWWE
jgi:hypothetical protein